MMCCTKAAAQLLPNGNTGAICVVGVRLAPGVDVNEQGVADDMCGATAHLFDGCWMAAYPYARMIGAGVS